MLPNLVFFFFFFKNPFLFKVIFNNINLYNYRNVLYLFNVSLNNFFFYSKLKNNLPLSNILPTSSFQYVYKKFVIRFFIYKKHNTLDFSFHYLTIIKFLEFCSGKKIYFYMNPFLNKVLNFDEQTQCLL